MHHPVIYGISEAFVKTLQMLAGRDCQDEL